MTHRKEGRPAKPSTTPATGGSVAGLVVWIKSVPTSFWLVIGLAALVRLWGTWNLSVEHFDEGVYASNIWFGADQGYEYPARFFYAPPLWPLVLEWTQLIGGMSGLGHPGWLVMLPGILCGIALCGMIYSFGKEFFCEQVGLLAGLMAACSDLLASYSRTALTDTPVTLCMLLAVRAMVRSLTAPTWGTIIAAGAWTALAWSIKYSGWLPLAILLASEFAGWFLKCHVLPVARVQKITLTICAIAVVLWLPVLWGLQATGGYQAVSANHAQYVTGLGQWFTQFQSQWETIRHYSTYFSMALLGSSIVAAGYFRVGGLTILHCNWLSLFCLLALGVGDLTIWMIGGSIGAYWGLVQPRFAIVQSEVPDIRTTQAVAPAEVQRIALLFLLTWMTGLLLSIPMYRSYPRLLTPIYPPVFLLFSYGYHRFIVTRTNLYLDRGILIGKMLHRAKGFLIFAPMFLLFALVPQTRKQPFPFRAWQDRTAIQETSQTFEKTIRQKTPSGQPAIAYIYGEPAVFWSLKSLGFDLAGPVQDLGFVDNDSPAEVWLVVGPHARRSEQFREQWELHGDSFIKEAEASARVSDIVRRDDESREEIALFELYRLRRAGS